MKLAILLLIEFVLATILVVCRVAPPKPSMPKTVAMLEQAAGKRDLLALQSTMAVKAATLSPPAFALAQVRGVRNSCGNEVRPYIWFTLPVLGQTFEFSYDPLGCLTASGHYVYKPTWAIFSFSSPMAEPIALPGGCELWLDPSAPATVVWSLRGDVAYADALLIRRKDGREARVSIPIPDEPQFMGLRAWTQLVTLGSADGGKMLTSQCYEITVGKARY
jgi:hypothetical protein